MDGLKNVGQVVEDYICGCESKVKSPFSKLFIKAVLAGAMIALGACAGNVASHAISNVGLARLASAVVFPVDDAHKIQGVCRNAAHVDNLNLGALQSLPAAVLNAPSLVFLERNHLLLAAAALLFLSAILTAVLALRTVMLPATGHCRYGYRRNQQKSVSFHNQG